MAFNGTFQQQKLLTQAVDEYCHDCGIEDGDERLYVTELVSALFDLGAISIADLRSGLETAIGGRSDRVA
ncbi:MAG: hypothetical protein JNK47_15190 [Mesorhizobium sp.]|nr:hypothetical protein [Mesorhizobium sp.]MBL8578568.1 hypothetical protein [Mesorhizobium sp.]